jgi:deoxyribodipyrimidine photo-lyase
MRELQATGFLSNRARMAVAQFAVKYLLLPWQKAEEAFRHLLLDGDRAVNLQGWQWAGGLGVDAAPYFRVFNLVEQGRRHDPDGAWLRRFAPEYPSYEPKDPVVDLGEARRRYLALAKGLIT